VCYGAVKIGPESNSMCGRYTLSAPSDLIEDLMELEESIELQPRFNIAPTQEAPVVLQRDSSASRRLETLRWGLVPFWAKDRSIGDRMINARSETVVEKPAFRASFKRKRCLVVADGFYEWQVTGGPKQPFFFRLTSREPFAMAGLWDRWDKGADGSSLETFAILTTEPNSVVEPVHKRMPVILERADYAAWLDPDGQDTDRLQEFLVPYPHTEMEGIPVSTYVNNPANQGPRCVEPIVLGTS